MRTLTNPFKYMTGIEIFRLLEKHTMYPATLCSFWKNLSGHFSRFACNHSYGYVFRRIVKTDSLRFPQNSAFSCTMRASPHSAQRRTNNLLSLLIFQSATAKKIDSFRLHFILFGFMNNILSGTIYRASPEGVSLKDETNKLAPHLERSPLIHSYGYASTGDRPTCFASLPINSKSFMQYVG